MTHRLASMGIRAGKAITKVSSMMMHGPVTIKIDNSQIALGHGMAKKIHVEFEG
ncbi:ferrous iron transport protein A [Chloroflexota bacterium]